MDVTNVNELLEITSVDVVRVHARTLSTSADVISHRTSSRRAQEDPNRN